jgi:hypothetical protein
MMSVHEALVSGWRCYEGGDCNRPNLGVPRGLSGTDKRGLHHAFMDPRLDFRLLVDDTSDRETMPAVSDSRDGAQSALGELNRRVSANVRLLNVTVLNSETQTQGRAVVIV